MYLFPTKGSSQLAKGKKTMKNSMLNQHDDGNEQEKEVGASSQKDTFNAEAETENADDQELPEKWKNMPFEDLKMEGWRHRIKNKGDKTYLTIRRNWLDADGKNKSLERGMGPFSEERYSLLQALLLDEASPEAAEGSQEDQENEDDSPPTEDSRIKVSEISSDRTIPQPPGYRGKGTKILTSGVAKHINIPDKFYYDTDILEFYEYFRDKGYKLSIVDFM